MLRTRTLLLTALACCLALLLAAPLGATQMEPKVDDFYLLIDMSGSMGEDFKDYDMSKYAMAKATLKRMNGEIPELGYRGSLVSLAPYTMRLDLETYETAAMEYAINGLPDDVRRWFGYPTPLGKGLQQLEDDLPPVGRRTAVVIFSDGGQNQGVSPVEVAEYLSRLHKGNLCFHIVSYAETAANQRTLDSIAALSDCSVSVAYEDVRSEDGLKGFVRDVFYEEVAGDADNDGVLDAYDDCPGTPRGVAVDHNGCAQDTDQDGVADHLDNCPGTPQGVDVDRQGCPYDTDGDGVYDFRDKCPDTPQALQVDPDGCPLPVAIELHVRFDTAKAAIKPRYHDELAEAAEFLKKYPGTEAAIEGHTDNVGDAAYNQKLSQRRADSVKRYLVEEFGIAADRLVANGLGESQPVASNDTPEGRQRNRRVQLVVSGDFERR
jgi:OOP family OmpA-OmpF porin